jgi:acyl carrier protein
LSEIRDTILQQIRSIAEQHKKPLAALKDDLPLAASGLDSLCIAILVAALDDELDIDPFSDKSLTSFPVTLGDFISLYEHEAA